MTKKRVGVALTGLGLLLAVSITAYIVTFSAGLTHAVANMPDSSLAKRDYDIDLYTVIRPALEKNGILQDWSFLMAWPYAVLPWGVIAILHLAAFLCVRKSHVSRLVALSAGISALLAAGQLAFPDTYYWLSFVTE